MADAEVISRIRREVATLADEFKGLYSLESIQALADEAATTFLRDATVLEFVPLLVYKFTRQRLQALSQAEGKVEKERPEILFVCVHNAGRSQMAAVMARHLSEGRVNVRSAGSTPATEINPVVVEAMNELGMSLSEESRAALRERLRASLPTDPDGSIRLIARAWAGRGRKG